MIDWLQSLWQGLSPLSQSALTSLAYILPLVLTIILCVAYLTLAERKVIGAIQNREYPIVQGGLLMIAVMVMIVNLTVDVLYGFINPKIRKS